MWVNDPRLLGIPGSWETVTIPNSNNATGFDG